MEVNKWLPNIILFSHQNNLLSNFFPFQIEKQLTTHEGKLDCLLGSLVGLSLFDSILVQYNDTTISEKDTSDKVTVKNKYDIFLGEPSDNTSIAILLLDTLIIEPEFNALDLQKRVYLWWFAGYRNTLQNKSMSIGLSNPFNSLFYEMQHQKCSDDYYRFKIINTDSYSIYLNGVIPVVIAYHDNPEQALLYSQLQCFALGGNEISASLCATLCYLLLQLLISTEEKTLPNLKKIIKIILQDWKNIFMTQLIMNPFVTEKHDYYIKIATKHLISLCDMTETPNYHTNWEKKLTNDEIKQLLGTRTNQAKCHLQYYGLYAVDAFSEGLSIINNCDTFIDIFVTLSSRKGVISNIASIIGQITGMYFGYEYLKTSDSKKWFTIFNNYNKDDLVNIGYYLFMMKKSK